MSAFYYLSFSFIMLFSKIYGISDNKRQFYVQNNVLNKIFKNSDTIHAADKKKMRDTRYKTYPCIHTVVNV